MILNLREIFNCWKRFKRMNTDKKDLHGLKAKQEEFLDVNFFEQRMLV